MTTSAKRTDAPRLSLIMPCYNEDQTIGYTVPRLLQAFRDAGVSLQLVAVDNGSTDRTRELLRNLATEHAEIEVRPLDTNEGYGNGILEGIPLCTGEWLGYVHADGQVDPEDVVRLYEAAAATDGRVLAKVRRRFRMDGWKRKVVSEAYNLLIRILWPRLSSLDVNGTAFSNPRMILKWVGTGEDTGWVVISFLAGSGRGISRGREAQPGRSRIASCATSFLSVRFALRAESGRREPGGRTQARLGGASRPRRGRVSPARAARGQQFPLALLHP